MQFLGTGTSQGIPMIACHCAVCTSNHSKDQRLRSSLLIKSNGVNIVIDVGPDFRQQILRSGVTSLDGILITHEHNDHIIGMDDVRPFNYKDKKSIKVFAHKRVIRDLEKRFEYIFLRNDYPGAPKIDLQEIEKNIPFSLKEQSILPFEVIHGKLPIFGFVLDDLCYITDAKEIREDQRQYIRNKKLLIINALHQYKHHSHFNLKEALEVIEDLNPEIAYITHISHRMGKYAEMAKRLPSNVFLAFDDCIIEI